MARSLCNRGLESEKQSCVSTYLSRDFRFSSVVKGWIDNGEVLTLRTIVLWSFFLSVEADGVAAAEVSVVVEEAGSAEDSSSELDEPPKKPLSLPNEYIGYGRGRK